MNYRDAFDRAKANIFVTEEGDQWGVYLQPEPGSFMRVYLGTRETCGHFAVNFAMVLGAVIQKECVVETNRTGSTIITDTDPAKD